MKILNILIVVLLLVCYSDERDLSKIRRHKSKSGNEVLDLHKSVSQSYDDYNEVYFITNTRMLIVERTKVEDFKMVKLVYSITISGNRPKYDITKGELNKTQSFFYFSQSEVAEFNGVDGCSIQHKEYTIVDLEKMCERIKNEVTSKIDGYDSPISYNAEHDTMVFENGFSGNEDNLLTTEEIDYRIEYLHIRLIAPSADQFYMYGKEGIFTPKQAFMISYDEDVDQGISKAEFVYFDTNITMYDTYTAMRITDGFDQHVSCIEEKCEYAFLYKDLLSPGRGYSDSWYKQYSKTEIKNMLANDANDIYAKYNAYVESLENQQTKRNRMVLSNSKEKLTSDKGYYYESADKNKYVGYFITSTLFTYIEQGIKNGDLYQYKFVKTLSEEIKSFIINTVEDFDNGLSGIDFEKNDISSCVGFIPLKDINTKCEGMTFNFPKGSFSFDNTKLIIEGNEKVEYDLTETNGESMMNIVNKISKSIKPIPKDKCVFHNTVKEDGSIYQKLMFNGIVYNEDTYKDWDYGKSFSALLENEDFSNMQSSSNEFIYTREGIDGYYFIESGYNFQFNKYIANTNAIAYEIGLDGNKLIKQYKSNFTEVYEFMKEKIKLIDNSDIETIETSQTIETSESTESNPTTQKEETVEITMILSNITSVDVSSLFNDIKQTIKKIYEEKNIILHDEDITIQTKESKSRMIEENKSIELEISIIVVDKTSKEEMKKIMKETSISTIKEELIKVNPDIYKYVGVEVDVNGSDNNGNRYSMMLLFTLFTLLLVLN